MLHFGIHTIVKVFMLEEIFKKNANLEKSKNVSVG